MGVDMSGLVGLPHPTAIPQFVSLSKPPHVLCLPRSVRQHSSKLRPSVQHLCRPGALDYPKQSPNRGFLTGKVNIILKHLQTSGFFEYFVGMKIILFTSFPAIVLNVVKNKTMTLLIGCPRSFCMLQWCGYAYDPT